METNKQIFARVYAESLMKDAPLELKQEIMEYLKNSCS
jgi:hypothetical protein